MVLLKSCGCISLRFASMLIGIVVLGLASFMVVMMLVYGIIWEMIAHKGTDITFGLIQTISIEYLNGMQILFAIILIYGCIKEVSSCVLGWLILQLAICVDSIITIAMMSVMHAYFVTEDFILLAKRWVRRWGMQDMGFYPSLIGGTEKEGVGHSTVFRRKMVSFRTGLLFKLNLESALRRAVLLGGILYVVYSYYDLLPKSVAK